MDAPNKPKKDLGARIKATLQHPTKLRIFVAISMISVWYFGFISPMAADIDETVKNLAVERKRIALGLEIEKLRVDLDRFEPRLPKKTDTNEWQQYILQSLHGSSLKLVMLDPEPSKEIGPYKVAVFRVSLEGTFREVDKFLRWMESDKRLFRIDEIRLSPHSSGKGMTAQFILLGVMG